MVQVDVSMSDQEDGEIADSCSDLSEQDIDEERDSVSDEPECNEQNHSDEKLGAYAIQRSVSGSR